MEDLVHQAVQVTAEAVHVPVVVVHQAVHAAEANHVVVVDPSQSHQRVAAAPNPSKSIIDS